MIIREFPRVFVRFCENPKASPKISLSSRGVVKIEESGLFFELCDDLRGPVNNLAIFH